MSTVQALAELGGKYDDVMLHCSRVFLRAALKAHGGCQATTALAIGVHRNTLYRHMRLAGIPTRVQCKARRKPVQRVASACSIDDRGRVVVHAAAVRTAAVAEAVEPADVARVDQLPALGAGVAEFFGSGQPAALSHTQEYRAAKKGLVAA